MIAEVIIDRNAKKLNRTFDYNIPKELEDLVIVGTSVLVPFGKAKQLEEAYVIGIKAKSEFEVKFENIISSPQSHRNLLKKAESP